MKRNMKKIQILNLNPSFDHTGIVKHKTDSSVVRVDEVVALPSGKGIDVARVLHILGYQKYVVSNIIGGRVGELIADGLKREGINVWNYLINDDSRINYAYVDEIKGKVFMINEPGPVITENEKKDYLNKLTDWLEEDQILVLSGSAMKGFTNEDIREIIRISRRKRMFIAVDISKHFLSACLKEGVDLLKINNKEFVKEYKDRYPCEFNEKKDFIRVIESEKLKRAIITFGKEGALLYDCGIILCGKNKKIFSDYSIGSGDSFLAGYLYGYTESYNISEALKLAMACGAANTRIYGAGRLKHEHVKDIKDNYIEILKFNKRGVSR